MLNEMNKAIAGRKPSPYRYAAMPPMKPMGTEVMTATCCGEKFFKGNKTSVYS